MPAVWASASVRITPGTIGFPGKCPANIGSSASNQVRALTDCPGSQSTSSRTKTNGGRWGRPRKGSEDRGLRIEDGGRVKAILYPPSSLRPSPVDEIHELPATLDPSNPDAVTVVIQRRIGKLRRRHPELVLLRELLRENPFQLRPEIVFIPILENAIAGFFRIKAVTEIFRHHAGERVYVVRRDSFLQPADERLEIDVVIFLPEIGLGAFVHRRFFVLFFRLEEIAATEGERTDKENKCDFFHVGCNFWQVCDSDSSREAPLPEPPRVGHEDKVNRAHQIDERTWRIGDAQRPASQHSHDVFNCQRGRLRNAGIVRTEGVEPMRVPCGDERLAEALRDFNGAAGGVLEAGPKKGK